MISTLYHLHGIKPGAYVSDLVGVYQTKHNAEDAHVRLKLKGTKPDIREVEVET